MSDIEHERGGVYECGVCRVALTYDHRIDEYKCPNCGWVDDD